MNFSELLLPQVLPGTEANAGPQVEPEVQQMLDSAEVTPDMINNHKKMSLPLFAKDLGYSEDKLKEVDKEVKDLGETHENKVMLAKEFANMRKAVTQTANTEQKPITINGKELPGGNYLEPMAGVSLRRFQDVTSKLPLVGPMIGEMNSFGGQPGREFAASRGNAELILNKILTNRVSPQALERIRDELPTGKESPKELQGKLQRILDFVDKNQSIQNLKDFGLIMPKAKKQ